MPATTLARPLPLLEQIGEIGRQAHVSALAVALYDYALDLRFSLLASRTFHAASTIKLAILFGLFRAAELGRLRLTDRLHVRNRFRSQADGAPSCRPTVTATRNFTNPSAAPRRCATSRKR